MDLAAKRLTIGFADLQLASGRGRVLTTDGFITLEWTRHADRLDYRLAAPAGWKIETVNDSGLPLRAL